VSARHARDGAAPELPLRARLEKHRDRLFRACSIVEACFRASASLYPPKDPEFIVPALEAVQEMLGDVASEIDEMAADLPRMCRAIPLGAIKDEGGASGKSSDRKIGEKR
jgi:hypothetical protein